MKGALLLVALVLGACGSTAGSGASPTATRTTVASPSSSPSASPPPSPLTSARGLITVSAPLANARVTSPLTIAGDASVFEANVSWQILDSAGRTLAQGFATASAGAPARGTYTITATFTKPSSDTIAIVQVFERSPKDGSIDEIVIVPVVITP